ncbi:MAG: hypothetical protein ACLQVD_04765 [Capsulimonadaceae bacterium]
MQIARKTSPAADRGGDGAGRPSSGIAIGAALVFAVFSALYLATRTQYSTFDAVSYSNQIAHLYPRTHDLHWLLHPHHLLFNGTGYLLWRMAQAFGYRGGPLVVLETYNAFIGAAGVAVFYVILRLLMQRSQGLPVLYTCGLGLSFGYWICSTDGRVNPTSTTLLLISFALLCVMCERATPVRAVAAGLIAGLAFLYHESAGLFVLVGLAGMAAVPAEALRGQRSGARLHLAMAFAVAWTAVAVTGYGVLGGLALRLHSVGAFHRWSAEYAELGWWWNFHIVHNLRLDVYALRHAAFVEPPGKRGTFHLAADTPTGLLALYFATLAGWFVAVYYFFMALPLLWRTHYRPVLIMSLVWMGLYGAFFTVWSPGYFVFWVPTLAPIALLLALSTAHYRSHRAGILANWLVGIWIAMYATVNVVASIGPHLQPMASPFARVAAEFRRHTRPGDLVLISGGGDLAEVEANIPYFADRDCMSFHTELGRSHDDSVAAISTTQALISRTLAAGHEVYVTDDLWRIYKYPDVVDKLQQHYPGFTPDTVQALFRPWSVDLAWPGSHGPVWKLLPPARVAGASSYGFH